MENDYKKILVVDDDEGFVDILEKTFKKTEFNLIIARDGEEGVEKAKSEKPDLILLDILMPLGGIETAKRLRQEKINVPIIFLTNVKDSEKVSEAMIISGGKADYIVKTDIHIEEIIQRIRQKLGLEQK